MRRPGPPAPTCAVCDVDLEDDPHWNETLEAFACEQHCDNAECNQSAGGGSDDYRPSARNGDRTPAAVPVAGSLLPAWQVRQLDMAAMYVRQERLSWLFTVCLWAVVVLVGLDAGR